MLKKATTIEDVGKYCTPKPLAEEDLDIFYIDTNEARDPEGNIFNRLKSLVLAEEEKRILFCGHKGCGKSTELNYLKKNLKDEIFCVSFSVASECNIFSLKAEELLLVIAERLLSSVKDAGIKVDERKLKEIFQYFSENSEIKEKEIKLGVEGGLGISSDDTIIAKFLGFLGYAKMDLKLGGRVLKTEKSTLIRRPSELLLKVNRLIEVVKLAVPKDKKLLIIVEDLDKINLSAAREIFIENYEYLKINASVIYTIPIFLFYAPDAYACRNNFDARISLPMIKVKYVSDGEKDVGSEIIKEMITARLDEKLFERGVLDMLIENTGGVLRHCFEVLQTASQTNSAFKEKKLVKASIEYGLNRLRDDLWMQVAPPYHPPPSGQIKIDDLYNRLAECYESQKKKRAVQPSPDTINQTLLMSSALIEYMNGEKRFVIHPILEDKIKNLGLSEKNGK